jgi:hypothetical protein
MWKEVFMAFFKVLIKHLCGGTEENHQKIQDSWCCCQYPEYKSEVFPLSPTLLIMGQYVFVFILIVVL